MSVVTLVLASGRGERLGGPKALLAWPAEGGAIPLAAAHARARLSAESSRVLVVSREDVARRLAPHLGTGAELVISRAPDALGPAGSIAAAAPRVEQDEAVVITPVDVPPASPQTVARLLDAVSAPVMAARPSFGARRGHPVVMCGSLLSRYRVLDPPPLRDLLRELGDAVAEVKLADSSVLVDFDTEADLSGYAALTGLPLAPRFF
jgi:CTP:molybdopterin cytidylyltransferase MocA